MLIWPTKIEYDISAILKTLKLSVARKAIDYLKKNSPQHLTLMEDRQQNGNISYRFWQRGGGFDKNLNQPVAIWKTIEYIHANPVRRQLCQHPIDWQWSSALEMEKPASGILRLNLESLPQTMLG